MKSDLQRIPGVGKRIEQHLLDIGIDSVASLVGQHPEDLYLRDSVAKGRLDDRCLLYVFRLAVYFAEQPTHDPQKLRWWYWKDHEYPCEP